MLKVTFIKLKYITSLLSILLMSHPSLAQPLRVGTTLWPGYEPLYLAQELSTFKEDIRMIEYPSTSEVLRAFKNRTVEAAALTLDEVVLLEESKTPVEIILVFDISEGADVIMARPEIDNIQGLIGTKVAIESTGVSSYTLSRALEIHNININQVTLVNAENIGHKNAYINKVADAVVTYEPVRTQLINAGAIEIFNSSEIPGEIIDVLVVHADVINTHQKELFDILQGWFKALDEIDKNPTSSYEFFASRMKISPLDAKNSYSKLNLPSATTNAILLSKTPQSLEQSFNRVTQHMKNNGLIFESTQPKAILNSQFLPR